MPAPTAPDLSAIPDRYAQPDPSTLATLPKPTVKNAEKGRCNECGGWHGLPAVHLPYMGHAEITLALIEIDPLWNWEPFTTDDGLPAINKEGNRLVMWVRLTVLDKTIICVGTCEAGKGDPEKELIGDLLRNCAMRFGIGTKLWSKADRDMAESGSTTEALIGEETAAAFTEHIKVLEPAVKAECAKQIEALTGTRFFAHAPLSLLPQVASIIMGAQAENYKVLK